VDILLLEKMFTMLDIDYLNFKCAKDSNNASYYRAYSDCKTNNINSTLFLKITATLCKLSSAILLPKHSLRADT